MTTASRRTVLPPRCRGVGRPPTVTDAELPAHESPGAAFPTTTNCVGYGLLVPGGHLLPRLLRRSEYNARLKTLAPLMEATLP
jgi:hypothetical protein